MEIKPAKLDQVLKSRNGKSVMISGELGSVAGDIKRINKDFELHADIDGGYYKVLQNVKDEKGQLKKHLILTSQDCDHRIVKRLEQIVHKDYDYNAEAERLEKQGKKDKEHRQYELVGEAGERLAFALRKDLGIKKNF